MNVVAKAGKIIHPSNKPVYLTETFEPSHKILSTPIKTPWSILFTCEHASNRLPKEFNLQWGKEDCKRGLYKQHWAYDLGSELLTREFLSHLIQNKPINSENLTENTQKEGSSMLKVVLARFSRLLLDCNRVIGAETMFRAECDNINVSINDGITEEDKERRIKILYHPYHNAIDQTIKSSELPPQMICSVHSFTDCYEGVKREVEIGVLFTKEYEEIGMKFVNHLRDHGYRAEDNKPWSAFDGLMYSADYHSKKFQPRAFPIMFEFRQDCLKDEEWRKKLVLDLHSIFSSPDILPLCSIY